MYGQHCKTPFVRGTMIEELYVQDRELYKADDRQMRQICGL